MQVLRTHFHTDLAWDKEIFTAIDFRHRALQGWGEGIGARSRFTSLLADYETSDDVKPELNDLRGCNESPF